MQIVALYITLHLQCPAVPTSFSHHVPISSAVIFTVLYGMLQYRACKPFELKGQMNHFVKQ